MHPLARLRLERRMTQADLASATGLTLTTIWRYETKGKRPTDASLILLADALDMNPLELADALRSDEPEAVGA